MKGQKHSSNNIGNGVVISPNYYFCLLLSLLSLTLFLMNGGTAYEWPAVDMGPFYERVNDPNFLKNDFFTNSTTQLTPRHIFGYVVVFIARLFNTDWYSIFYFFKLIFIVLIPALIYLFIVGILRQNISRDKEPVLNFFLLIGISLLLFDYGNYFSIAWWQPIFNTVTSQSFSLLLFLIGSLFLLYSKGNLKYIYLLFWSWATLNHFTVSICLITFYFLASAGSFKWKFFASTFIIAVIVPVAALLVFFTSSQDSLAAKEFIQIYVRERHPSHYLFSQFGTLTSYSWWMSYLTIISLIAAAVYFYFIKKKYTLLLVASLFLMSYGFAPFIQYLATEVIQSKFLSAFGPVRFSFLGYWMLMVLYGHLITTIDYSNVLPKLSFKIALSPYYYYAVIFIAVMLSFSFSKDDPYSRIRTGDDQFYSWIKANTEPDAVFASYDSDYQFNIPLVGRRAIYLENGFPFSEKFFKEYHDRRALIYGDYEKIKSLPGEYISQKSDVYYSRLTPLNLNEVSKKYKLDYVVMRKEQGENLRNNKPVFENDKIKVYKIKSLIP